MRARWLGEPVLFGACLLAAAVTGFVALTPSRPALAGSPRAIAVTAVNSQGAALTQTIHDQAGLHRLEGDFERLVPQVPGEAFPCPADDGSRYRAVFAFASGRTEVAEIRRTGCEAVTLAGRWAPTVSWRNPQLLRDLEQLFPPQWQTGF